jgi:hypothetical protein
MNVQTLLNILNGVAELEPVAAGLVLSLINGLKGKSDAEILQGDATVWAAIVTSAHAQLQPPAPPTPPITQ